MSQAQVCSTRRASVTHPGLLSAALRLPRPSPLKQMRLRHPRQMWAHGPSPILIVRRFRRRTSVQTRVSYAKEYR